MRAVLHLTSREKPTCQLSWSQIQWRRPLLSLQQVKWIVDEWNMDASCSMVLYSKGSNLLNDRFSPFLVTKTVWGACELSFGSILHRNNISSTSLFWIWIFVGTKSQISGVYPYYIALERACERGYERWKRFTEMHTNAIWDAPFQNIQALWRLDPVVRNSPVATW
jgi:hypothetical protein